jgi:hypothetical protein
VKIRPVDYAEMCAAVARVIAQHPDAQRQYKDAGLSDRRFRWDVLHASKYDICRLYSNECGGLNDTHIDTALRRAVASATK